MQIGLIGFGFMGKTHCYALRNLPYFYGAQGSGFSLGGVCTAHRKTAEEAAALYGIPFATENEDDLILSPDIDVIDICTPNIYHYETARKAILAGKHVYCEKPLAVTEKEADTLCGLAEKKGVKAGIVFNNRFMSGVLAAKALAEKGKLGRLLSFRCAYLHSSCTDPRRPAGWKQDRRICGGGVLFDLGSHAIDLIRYLCGEFAEVSGKSQIAYPVRCGRDGNPWETDGDEAFYMTATLACGAVGTIEVSKLALGTNDDLSFALYGEKGSLRFSLMQPNYLEFYDGTREDGVLGGERGFTQIECVSRYPAPAGIFPGVKAPTGWLTGHVGAMYNFLSSVRDNTVLTPSFRDGAAVQHIMERAYRSSENGGKAETI